MKLILRSCLVTRATKPQLPIKRTRVFKKKIQIKKIFLSAILIVSFLFLPLRPAKADIWGASLGAASWQVLQQQFMAQMKGVLLSAAKQAAASAVNALVNRLVSGGSGAPKFIGNWKDYIIRDTAQKTTLYMNDYLTQATRGTGDPTTYKTEGSCQSSYDSCTDGAGAAGYCGPNANGSLGCITNFDTACDQLMTGDPCTNSAGKQDACYLRGISLTCSASAAPPSVIMPDPGFRGTYAEALTAGMKKSVMDETKPLLKTTITDPGKMYAKGTFQSMYTYVSGINSPWALSANLEKEKKTEQAANQAAATAEGVAGNGFTSTKKGDTIITPGKTTGDILSSTQDIGNKILAAAGTPGEVISSAIMNIITKTITQGIGNAASKASQQINSRIDKAINNCQGNNAVNGFNSKPGSFSSSQNKPVVNNPSKTTSNSVCP